MFGFEKDPIEIEIDKKRTTEYQALNVPAKREKELRASVLQAHANHLKRIFGDVPRQGSNRLWALDKQYRAYLIWAHHEDCPDVSISKLCQYLSISQGYFRELRQIRLIEWKIEHLDFIENLVIQNIIDANNPAIDDANYIIDNGEELQRSALKIYPSS